MYNIFFGPGVPFPRRLQALNLAWIIAGKTYDVASSLSHAFRTNSMDHGQVHRAYERKFQGERNKHTHRIKT